MYDGSLCIVVTFAGRPYVVVAFVWKWPLYKSYVIEVKAIL